MNQELVKFFAVNSLPHPIVGLLIATILYPFLNKEYQKRKNYVLLIAIPSLFGSEFPDIMHIIALLLKYRTFEIFKDIKVLEEGGIIYSVFHLHFPLILVVPCTVFLVIVIIKLLNLKLKNKIKIDKLPNYWLFYVGIISLLATLSHIAIDYLDTIFFPEL